MASYDGVGWPLNGKCADYADGSNNQSAGN
jgi:hypothetical protein